MLKIQNTKNKKIPNTKNKKKNKYQIPKITNTKYQIPNSKNTKNTKYQKYQNPKTPKPHWDIIFRKSL